VSREYVAKTAHRAPCPACEQPIVPGDRCAVVTGLAGGKVTNRRGHVDCQAASRSHRDAPSREYCGWLYEQWFTRAIATAAARRISGAPVGEEPSPERSGALYQAHQLEGLALGALMQWVQTHAAAAALLREGSNAR